MSTFTAIGLLASLLVAIPRSAKAEDAATLYKTKCATCHAPDGSGRKALKGSNLLTPEAKKLSDAQLTEAIAKGGAKKDEGHAFEKKGMTADQVKMLVQCIRELQKKAK